MLDPIEPATSIIRSSHSADGRAQSGRGRRFMFDSPISKTIDVPAGEAPAAASTDQLARAFLKALAQKERERWKHGAKEASNASFVDDDDPVEKIIAQDEPDRQAQHVPVPPGRALTAVLVARAIEADSDVLRRLRRENPVVVIATHMPELIDATRYVVEKCALPTDTFVKDLNGSKYHDLRRSEVGLVVRDGSGREHNPDTGNAAIGAAFTPEPRSSGSLQIRSVNCRGTSCARRNIASFCRLSIMARSR
ncbi:hypothetical protein GCM10007887_18350 [Methylobacterium haplocladii]|nr:hypothetical protein GCM10007887_18350 [Methylobacterium haplocladii]